MLGRTLGRKLKGGEVIELVSDLGGGKTVLVRGLAEGLGSQDRVQSPTFTLSRVYKGRGNIEIHHFDFHRLGEGGVVAGELVDLLADPKVVIAIEWSDIVRDVLPPGRLIVEIKTTDENTREFKLTATDAVHARLARGLDV